MNSNPYSVTTIEPRYLLTNAFRRGAMDYPTYYYTQGYASFLCQYFANGNAGHITDAYYYSDPWNATFWSRNYAEEYSGFIAISDQAMDLAKEQGLPNQEGPAKIWRAFLFHRMTDIWGAVPYFEAFDEENLTPGYTSQQEIYNDMFVELEAAVNLIDKTSQTKRMETSDIIFYDDLDKWERFANSLRLRLAMRLVNVDATKARTEFEAALQADGGIMTDNADNAGVICDATGPASLRDWNPIKVIAEYFPDWFKVSETFLDMLTDLEDPRVYSYLAPTQTYVKGISQAYSGLITTDMKKETIDFISGVKKVINNVEDLYAMGYGYLDQVEDTIKKYGEYAGNNPMFIRYKGLRNGLPPSELSVMQSDLKQYSQVSGHIKAHEYPTYAFVYPEVCFLLAEAALRNWNVTETAEEFYNEGVRAAFEMYNLDNELVDEYLAKNPLETDADFETQLEQIITQKYIMNYTNGFESWSEWKRTGYPRLLTARSLGDTDGHIPRRWMYTVDQKRFNEEKFNIAVQAMGGVNSMMVPNWWDSKYSTNPETWTQIEAYDYKNRVEVVEK